MHDKINVMVTSVGSGVALSIIKALNLASKNTDTTYDITGTDIDPLTGVLYRLHKGYIVPRTKEPQFIEKIKEICTLEDIDIIIPGSDPDVLKFAQNKREIEESTRAKVIVNPLKTVEIGFDKLKTANFLKETGFNYALSALPDEVDSILGKTGFPLIAKPREGSGSVGLYVINNEKELEFVKAKTDDSYVIQEMLKPEKEEYTTGLLFSKSNELLYALTLWRKLKKGASYKAIADDFDEVNEYIKKIGSTLDCYGHINFQSRLTRKGPTVFEINPRFSGTTVVLAVAGFNTPHLMIQNILFDKKPENIKINKLVMSRHLNEVYVTLDQYKKGAKEGVIEPVGGIIDYV